MAIVRNQAVWASKRKGSSVGDGFVVGNIDEKESRKSPQGVY